MVGLVSTGIGSRNQADQLILVGYQTPWMSKSKGKRAALSPSPPSVEQHVLVLLMVMKKLLRA